MSTRDLKRRGGAAGVALVGWLTLWVGGMWGQGATAEGPVADRALERFFRAHLDARFGLHPMEATRLGDHRLDDRLDVPTEEAERRWREFLRGSLRELGRAVDYRALSRDGQIDFEILRDDLGTSLWLAENTRPYEEDPRVYLDHINDGIYLLFVQSTLPREVNVRNAMARMAVVPQVIEVAMQRLKRPPRAHTETAVRQNRGAIAFFERDLFELVGDTPLLAELRAAAEPVVAALRRFQQFLEADLLPRADGEWRLGRARFRQKLERVLNAGSTAEEVLEDAEREFERVRNEMYVIARQLWGTRYPGRALPPDDAEGRRATIERVLASIATDHGTPESLTSDVRRTVVELREFIAARDILRLPEPDRCEIIEMPEFQRGNSTAYMNSPPPLDPEARGFYAVSPPPKDWDATRVRSYFEEYNASMLKILSIHEAYPGHYVQLEYANRNPSLIRKVLGSGVYIEGWAVYTEQMMLDQGFGAGELGLRLTQLKFYLRAVANAILDHRMHCTRMTDEEAMDLLVKQAFQADGEARLKVVRAKQSSVQLSTYFVGRMGHYRLRQEIEREQGETFELGRFHEAVLAPGSVPLKYLPELVRRRLSEAR